MSSHSVPAGALTREQINQIAQAAQNDPTVQPYRSFSNLSEGKIMCVMEAPDEEALATWFKKMQMPCDSITPWNLKESAAPLKKFSWQLDRPPFISILLGALSMTGRCVRQVQQK